MVCTKQLARKSPSYGRYGAAVVRPCSGHAATEKISTSKGCCRCRWARRLLRPVRAMRPGQLQLASWLVCGPPIRSVSVGGQVLAYAAPLHLLVRRTGVNRRLEPCVFASAHWQGVGSIAFAMHRTRRASTDCMCPSAYGAASEKSAGLGCRDRPLPGPRSSPRLTCRSEMLAACRASDRDRSTDRPLATTGVRCVRDS